MKIGHGRRHETHRVRMLPGATDRPYVCLWRSRPRCCLHKSSDSRHFFFLSRAGHCQRARRTASSETVIKRRVQATHIHTYTQPEQLPPTIYHHQNMANLAFIAFALLAVVPPLYTRYEHLHRRDDPIPTQVKWAAQVAVGSGAAAHSVCRIATRVRGADPDTLGGSFYCSALGVVGGAASTGAMARGWDEKEWAYVGQLTERVSRLWEDGRVGAASRDPDSKGEVAGDQRLEL